jgi:hypothetical protein
MNSGTCIELQANNFLILQEFNLEMKRENEIDIGSTVPF